MTTQPDLRLMQRINDFALSDAAAEISFASKLADENHWTLGYATLVEQEYRKFMYLSKVAGHMVCPSKDVDQAWHLHLTQTLSYQAFCNDVLGEFLHHIESKGGSAELQKHQKMYEATLASYRQIIGQTPPAGVWPGVKKRFSLAREKPMEALWQWPFGLAASGAGMAIPVVLVAVACAAVWVNLLRAPVFPNMGGPTFLKLYGFALVATAPVFWLLRHLQQKKLTDTTTTLDAYEAAWLCGGSRRVFSTALASLVKRGVLELLVQGTRLAGSSTRCKRTDVAVDRHDLHPVERSCLDAMPQTSADVAIVAAFARGKVLPYTAASHAIDTIRRRLENAGLLYARGDMSALLGRIVAWLSLLLMLAIARLMHGFMALQPIGFLLLLIPVNMLTIAVCLKAATTTTAWGRKVVADLQSSYAPLRRKTGRTLPLFAMGFAVFGMQSVSADPRFDGLRRIAARANSAGGTGGSDGGGCGAGDSGGGGCGG